MTHFPFGRSMASAVVAVAALGGCAGYSVDQPAVTRIAPGESSIVFTAPEFKGATPVYIEFTDPWQREEYALFQGGGNQAEMIYSAAEAGSQLALEYPFTVDTSVETWNLNRRQTKSWGETRWFRGPFVGFFYQPYRLVEANRDCFGFSSTWDDPSDDPDHRPGKVLFGYYCAREGDALTRGRMEALLDDIGIRGISERVRHDAIVAGTAPGAGNQTDAVRVAQTGVPGAVAGNPGFPFDLARHYQIHGGDRLLN